jgi:uncharacterized membrane protein
LIRPKVSRIGASHLREVLVADHPAYRARPQYFDPRRSEAAYASVRASDADRERLVEVLKNGFAEGRLTQDEYNLRMGHAYTARTYGELGALVADLPGGGAPFHPAYAFPAYRAMKPNSMAVASLVCGLFGITAIPAVILGHKALRQIRQTGEPGRGMAKAGLILGWTAIAVFALLVVLAVLAAVVVTSHSAHAPVNVSPHAGAVEIWLLGSGPGGG